MSNIKAELKIKLKAFGGAPKDEVSFAAARAHMRSIGGAPTLRAHLESEGLLAEDGLNLKVGLPGTVTPFNVFACVASGHLVQPGMKEENAALGSYASKFAVARNRPDNDDNWASDAPEWVGRASMGQRHRFLTTRDLSWTWFNVLSVGLDGRASSLREALTTLDALHEAAHAFARGTPGWSDAPERLSLFFHCFPYNSVPSLHMHVVDLGATGPTFEDQLPKRLLLSAVRAVLVDELANAEAREQHNLTLGGLAAAATVALRCLPIGGRRWPRHVDRAHTEALPQDRRLDRALHYFYHAPADSYCKKQTRSRHALGTGTGQG